MSAARPPTANRAPGRYDRLAPVLVGVAAAAAVLSWCFGGGESKFEEAALGPGTSSVFATWEGEAVHTAYGRQCPELLAGWVRRGRRPAALWLGNSQLHGVNQAQPGQQCAPALLFERLHAQGMDLLTVSPPNATPQEHLVVFEYVRSRTALKLLILAVCFDDLRNAGIRGDHKPLLRDEAVRAALATTAAGRELLRAESQQGKQTPGQADQDATLHDRAEKLLNETLARHWRLWRTRPEARGRIFLGLYRLRNAAFGITPQTKRRMLRPRYESNMAAVEAMLDQAARAKVRVLVYVPPLRQDVAPPYDPAEYARFKDELKSLVESKGGRYANLEALVPARFWGHKAGTALARGAELDFMHFQASGHRLLAEAVWKLAGGGPKRERRP